MVLLDVATVMPAVLRLVYLPRGRGGGGRCCSACSGAALIVLGSVTTLTLSRRRRSTKVNEERRLWTRHVWNGDGVDRCPMGGRRSLGDALPKRIRTSD